jgi:uncharacterized MAPEG superfamily protein
VREGGDLHGSIVILLDVNGKISLQFVCAACFFPLLICLFSVLYLGSRVLLSSLIFFSG